MMEAIKRAVVSMNDRRLTNKYSAAAHTMAMTKAREGLLGHLTGTNAAKGYNKLADDLSQTDRKTSKRIDKLAGNPELKATVDKNLGLNQPEKGTWD
jgi:hypothetical protein